VLEGYDLTVYYTVIIRAALPSKEKGDWKRDGKEERERVTSMEEID
jgi:hypothetical protein